MKRACEGTWRLNTWTFSTPALVAIGIAVISTLFTSQPVNAEGAAPIFVDADTQLIARGHLASNSIKVMSRNADMDDHERKGDHQERVTNQYSDGRTAGSHWGPPMAPVSQEYNRGCLPVISTSLFLMSLCFLPDECVAFPMISFVGFSYVDVR